jgi:hypothetical protein
MDLSYDERAKKNPRGLPRGGRWDGGGNLHTLPIDTWYRKKLHLFGIFFQEIVAAELFFSLRRHAEGVKTVYLNL